MRRCALSIDSWRWSGVPFYMRAGKCLPVTATEVVVDLRPPPAQGVRGSCGPSSPITCAFGSDPTWRSRWAPSQETRAPS